MADETPAAPAPKEEAPAPAPAKEEAPAKAAKAADAPPKEEPETVTYNPGDEPEVEAPNGEPYVGVSHEFMR